MRLLTAIVISAGFIWVGSARAQEAAHGRVFVDIKSKGSLPPVASWYSCAMQMKGETAYDGDRARSCLQQILKIKYLTGGHVETHKAGPNVEVDFVLQALPLKLTEVDYGIPKDWEESQSVDQLIHSDKNVLRLDDVYDASRDAYTIGALKELLRYHAIKGTVSRTAYLDYGNQTARLAYKIWEGVPSRRAETWDSAHPDCKVLLAGFSLFDETHNTPPDLIQRLSSITVPSCYSEVRLREDEATMMKTGPFDAFRYDVIRGDASRAVSLHVRTKELQLSTLAFIGSGLLDKQNLAKAPDFPAIPMQVGDRYSTSVSGETIKVLKHHYERVDTNIAVYEEDQLTAPGGLAVTFHVLAYPSDKVYIDGQEVSPEAGAPSATKSGTAGATGERSDRKLQFTQ